MSATAEDTPASSAAPTECTYDESLKDYMKCNKQRFTTTQLVGAGIGVTVLIFALAFGLIWFCKRRRQPRKVKPEERDGGRRSSIDDEDDTDEESDEDSELDVDEKPGSTPADTRGDKSLPPAPIEKEATKKSSASDTKSIKSVQPPPAARLGDDLKTSTRNERLNALGSGNRSGSRISSHAGSPTEPRGVRNLYPSNPDAYNSPRSTLYGAPPTRGSRPPSTYSQVGRPPTQHGNNQDQPPLPSQMATQGANPTRRPTTSSGLKPVDLRAYPSRSTSVAGSRRPSIAPSDRSSGVLPDEKDMEMMIRTPSTRSTASTALPQGDVLTRPPPSRTSSIASTHRPPSRMSIASRKSSYIPAPPAVPPPAYHEGVVQNVPMRPQPVRSGTIVSQIGNARMSSAASVEVFEDAQETFASPVGKSQATPRPAPKRQQAVRTSSDYSVSRV